jgi:hypothetical protein
VNWPLGQFFILGPLLIPLAVVIYMDSMENKETI